MCMDWRMERRKKLRESSCSGKKVHMRKWQPPHFSDCGDFRFLSCLKAESLACGFAFLHFMLILILLRNPKLKSIPKLAHDLQMISRWSCKMEESSHLTPQERDEMNIDACHQSRKSPPKFNQDLNSLPNSVAACDHSRSQQNEQCSSVNTAKKRRAASERIARIALQDLAKYFDLPILEASKNLKVGLTVLKKKCREFGIPRWPHRKIKSLDGLIHELEDVGWQQQEDEAAATAVAKRRQMLEEEKESIERKPCMEIQSETKKFRQDIFKRRHRARVHKKQA